MGNIKDKQRNVPIDLNRLLRRRKLTLEQYVRDNGIVTYELLVNKCARLGVIPPTQDDFAALGVQLANSPAEGIVIVESPHGEVEQPHEEEPPRAHHHKKSLATKKHVAAEE